MTSNTRTQQAELLDRASILLAGMIGDDDSYVNALRAGAQALLETPDYARRHDADQRIILRQQGDIDRLEAGRRDLLVALRDAVSRLEFDGYRIADLTAAIAKAESGGACERYRELAGPFERGLCDKCHLPESLHGSEALRETPLTRAALEKALQCVSRRDTETILERLGYTEQEIADAIR